MKKKIDQKNSPSFLEQIARSRSKEHVERKKQLQESPYHPSEELLRQYVLAELDKSDTEIVMEHVSLCGICARKALKITWELKETESLMDKIKGFVSSLSFPVFVQFPALEPVRGTVTEAEARSYSPGEEIILTFEAPGDGHVTIFYGCEETGEIRLVFPLEPEDDSQVRANQQLTPIRGAVEGPAGKHFFTVFWTRMNLLNHEKLNLQDEHVCNAAIEHFFEALEELDEDEWASTTTEYEVLAE